MKNPKTIYIGGKVTGLSRIEASHKFGAVQRPLIQEGHRTIVPLDIVPKDASWEVAMRICIAALMTADELHLLPNWNESRGAMIERDIAMKLNIPIVYC